MAGRLSLQASAPRLLSLAGLRQRCAAKRTHSIRVLLMLALCMLFACVVPLRGQDDSQKSSPSGALGFGELDIAGLRLVASPHSQTVPFQTSTVVNTDLLGFDPASGSLPEGLLVRAELVGPEIEGQLTLEAIPGQPLPIPRLRLEGDYRVQNIRLVQGDTFLAEATPSEVSVQVTQILVTEVSSRALTLDEIRDYGIVIDEDRFQALSLSFAFGVAGEQVRYTVPVVVDLFGNPVGGSGRRPGTGGGGSSSPRFAPPQLVPFTFKLEREPSSGPPRGGCAFRDCRDPDPVPPMVGVILFPMDVGLLHQHFSVVLMVQNGAPEGDPLVVRDLTARLVLPPGLREAETRPPTPLGVPVPVRVPGPDGELGTADDLSFLVAQASGEVEALVEGLQEGTHVVDFELEGLLEGLPGGLQRITGRARGAVVVRDPSLSVTISHPDTVRTDEEYNLFLTVANTGVAPVNLLSLALPAHGLAGVEAVEGFATEQTIDQLLPGDSQTVVFVLRSLRTGRVVASTARAGSAIDPRFELRVGVGELGIPLSPDAIVLSSVTEHLPQEVVRQSLALIGLAHSLATAPPDQVDPGLPRITSALERARVYRLTAAGRHVRLGGEVFDSLAVMAAEWNGARDQDPEWDALRRRTRKGRSFAAALGAAFAAEAASATAESMGDRFAASTHFLAPSHLLLAEGSDVDLELISRADEQQVITGAVRELPFAELYPLSWDPASGVQDPRPGATRFGTLALLAAPEATGYRVQLRARATGNTDLHLWLPAASGARRAVRFRGLSLQAGDLAVLEYREADSTFTLQVDEGGDGSFDRQRSGQMDSVPVRPFEVLAAVQNSSLDPSGHVLDLLFTQDVDLRSLLPADPDHFQLPGKVSNGGMVPTEADQGSWLAPDLVVQNPFAGLYNTRVLRVVFDNPISPLRSHDLLVSQVASARGEVLESQTVPVLTTVPADGVEVRGQVIGADGQGVPFAEVSLAEWDAPDYSECIEHTTAAVRTDAEGYFHFDFVRRNTCNGGLFRLRAVDPVRSHRGSVTGRARLAGQTQNLDLVMTGRGKLQGRVVHPDGSVPDGLRVVAHNPIFGDGRLAWVGEDGSYEVDDVVVGTVTLAATDSHGNVVYQTLELPHAGSTVTQDLVLLNAPDPAGPGVGELRGRVMNVDGTLPEVDAYVALYVEGRLIAVERSAEDGGFDFGSVPAGRAELEAFDGQTGRRGALLTFQLSADQIRDLELRLRDDRGTVEGYVYRQMVDGSVQPVDGAVVWVGGQPANTTTDSHGFYRLDEVLGGDWPINAVDVAASEQATALATVSDGSVVNRDLYFFEELAAGGISGEVLGFDGQSVVGAEVHLAGGYQSQRWSYAATTDSAGRFVLADVAPGSYGVHASIGTVGGLAFTTVRFLGDTPFVTVRFRRGSISGCAVAEQADGSLLPVISTLVYRTTVTRLGLVGMDLTPRTLVTEDNGCFSLEQVLVGPYELSVHNAFHGSQKVRGELLVDGENHHHELRFEPNGDIDGVVLMPDGITPASGALVRLEGGSFSDYELYTDDQGRFAFPFVPAGHYRLKARLDQGLVFRQERVSVAVARPGDRLEVEVVLPEQGTVFGWVEDAEGNVVPGAVVTLREDAWPRRRLVHNADGEGAFRFDNIFAGDLTVSAKAPSLGGLGGSVQVRLTAEGEEVLAPVVLEPTAEISGVVRNPESGLPVAGAEVRLLRSSLFDSLNTEDDGSFRFRLLPLGSYRIRVYDPTTARRGRSGWLVLSDAGEEVQAEVLLEVRGEVGGHLYDRQSGVDVPVPGAVVLLRSRGLRRFATYSSSGLDGAFLFGGIPEGGFDLLSRDPADGRRTARASGEVSEEDERVEVDLAFELTGQLRVNVLNPPGLPPAGGLYPAVNTRVIEHGSTLCAALENPVQCPGLRSGKPLDVRVDATDGTLHRGRWQGYLQEEGVELEVDLVLEAIGSATLEVEDSLGHPVPGADVHLEVTPVAYPRSWESFHASTGVDHRAHFEEVRQGHLRARATDPRTGLKGSATASLQLEGEDVQILVRLQDNASLRGCALLSDGVTPAAEALVALGTNIVRPADQNGCFSFESLRLGAYTLTVQEHLGPHSVELRLELGENGEDRDLGNLVMDTDDPEVIEILPTGGSRDVARNASMLVRFSEPMDTDRFSSSWVALRKLGSLYSEGRSFSWSADGTELTITPDHALANDTGYLLEVRSSAVDRAGRHLPWLVRSTFYTADEVQPKVIEMRPAAGAEQVAVDTPLELLFSEPLDETSLSGPAIQLEILDPLGGPASSVGTTFQLRPGERESIVTPVGGLLSDQHYRLTVQGVQDLAGNSMAAPFVTEFWTVDTVAPELSWSAPEAAATYVSGDSITLEVQASDLRGMASLEFDLGAWQRVLTTPTSGESTWSWTVAVPVVTEAGSLNLVATAEDRFGNRSTATRQIQVQPRVNAAAPSAELVCPADGDLVAPGLLHTLHLTLGDDEAVESWQLLVDGVTVHQAAPVDQVQLPLALPWTPPAEATPGTVWSMRLEIRDFAGNTSALDWQLAAPTVSILGPGVPLDSSWDDQGVALASGEHSLLPGAAPASLVLLQGALLQGAGSGSLSSPGELRLQCGSGLEALSLDVQSLYLEQAAWVEVDGESASTTGLILEPHAHLQSDEVLADTVELSSGSVLVTRSAGARQMVLRGGSTVQAMDDQLSLVALERMQIDAEALVSADWAGYAPGGGFAQPGHAPPGVAPSQPTSGGSHGGAGAVWRNGTSSEGPAGETFGSPVWPVEAGGGGSGWNSGSGGGAGGGAIRIDAGELVLDGLVSALGESGPGTSVGAGGAGGSVLLQAAQLSGVGLVDASGGYLDLPDCPGFQHARSEGSGGGGRVAVHAGVLQGFDPELQLRAWGGAYGCRGQVRGHAAPGTVLLRTPLLPRGWLRVDQGRTAEGDERQGPATELPRLDPGSVQRWEVEGEHAWLQGDQPFPSRWLGTWVELYDAQGTSLGSFEALSLNEQGELQLSAAGAVIGATSYRGGWSFDRLDLRAGAALDSLDPVHAEQLYLEGEAAVAGTVQATTATVLAGSRIGPGRDGTLRLDVSGTLTVEAGAALDVSGQGYSPGNSGVCGFTYHDGQAPPLVEPARYMQGGGSHGGPGGAGTPQECAPGNAGEVYDSPFYPRLGGGSGAAGSQGEPGAGGGVVIIEAQRLQLDGDILALGGDFVHESAGINSAGAGGTVRLELEELTGSGTIDATGGDVRRASCDSRRAGSGGGGRVALLVDQLLGFDPETQVRVYGGRVICNDAEQGYAGPGTLHWRLSTQSHGTLLLDNGTDAAGQARPESSVPLPALGEGTVGTVQADGSDLWITPADPGTRFGLGVTGMWLRIGGTDYEVIAENGDRRTVLIAGAAAAVQEGDIYRGVLRLDRLVLRRGVRLQLADGVEATQQDVDADSSIESLDLVPPQITGLTPAEGGSFVSGTGFTVSVQASDDRGVTEVRIELDGLSFSDSEAPYEFQVAAPAVSEVQDLLLVAEAMDAAGNTARLVRTLRVEPAGAVAPGPQVSFTGCWQGGDLVAPGAVLPLPFSMVESDGQIERYTFLVNGEEQLTQPVVGQSAVQGELTWTVPADAVAGQTFLLRLEARNFSGGVGVSELQLVVPASVSILPDGSQLDSSLDGLALLLAPGQHQALSDLAPSSLVLSPGAILEHAGPQGLRILSPGPVKIGCNARVDLHGRGHAGGTGDGGPGAAPSAVSSAQNNAGGSHGGSGLPGAQAGTPGESFGSPYWPRFAGGGGASRFWDHPAGAGGGALWLEAGSVVLDGQILLQGVSTDANDSGEGAGAGAGGALYLKAASLRGKGLVDARGGSHLRIASRRGGPGGGGRVALEVSDLSAFDVPGQILVFGGQHVAPDGSAVESAGAGTLFLRHGASTHGELWIMADPLQPAPAAGTQIPTAPSFTLGAVTVAGNDLWIEPQESALIPAHGLEGSWLQVGDQRFQILEQSADRRSMLLAGAALANPLPAVGDSASGLHQLDRLRVLGGAWVDAPGALGPAEVEIEGEARLPQPFQAADLTLRSGARLLPFPDQILDLRLSGRLTVEAGATIDASGYGYQGSLSSSETPETAPGVQPAEANAGGSHGGLGTVGDKIGEPGELFDSPYAPSLGGGGGGGHNGYAVGGHGGGVVLIQAAEVVLEGEVWADGQGTSGYENGLRSGAGAGGTVSVEAGSLTGGGRILARGGDHQRSGNSYGGVGGGGRVALVIGQLLAFDPASQVETHGGARIRSDGSITSHAGAGTLYVLTPDGGAWTGDFGTMLLDARTTSGAPVESTTLPALGAGAVGSLSPDFQEAADLWIEPMDPATLFPHGVEGMWLQVGGAEFPVLERSSDGRQLLLQGASGQLEVGDNYQGVHRLDRILVRGGASLRSTDPVQGVAELAGPLTLASPLDTGSMVLRAGSRLSTFGSELEIRAGGSVTVESGATVDVSHLGSPGDNSTLGYAPTSVLPSARNAGGSHGGEGMTGDVSGSSGEIYDSPYHPELPGGSGASYNDDYRSGSGGGVLRLVAASVVLDGQLMARGEDSDSYAASPSGYRSGAGAGGTVVVESGSLSGSGVIDASGGAHLRNGRRHGGPGAGGRVALWVDDLSAFDASTQVLVPGGPKVSSGGNFTSFGGAGSVYLHDSAAVHGSMIVDQRLDTGQSARWSSFPTVGSGTVGLTEVDGEDPAALWIEPSDPNATFGLGVRGIWVRIGSQDFQVRAQSEDRRRLLLADATGAVAVGESYEGVHKLDSLTLRNGTRFTLSDRLEVGVLSVEGPGVEFPEQGQVAMTLLPMGPAVQPPLAEPWSGVMLAWHLSGLLPAAFAIDWLPPLLLSAADASLDDEQSLAQALPASGRWRQLARPELGKQTFRYDRP